MRSAGLPLSKRTSSTVGPAVRYRDVVEPMNRRDVTSGSGRHGSGRAPRAHGVRRRCRFQRDRASGAGAAPPLAKDGLRFWLETSLKRVYPTSPPGGAEPLPLVTPRNARLSLPGVLPQRQDQLRHRPLRGRRRRTTARRASAASGSCRCAASTRTCRRTRSKASATSPACAPTRCSRRPRRTSARTRTASSGSRSSSRRTRSRASATITVRLTLEDEFSYVDFTRPQAVVGRADGAGRRPPARPAAAARLPGHAVDLRRLDLGVLQDRAVRRAVLAAGRRLHRQRRSPTATTSSTRRCSTTGTRSSSARRSCSA